ncbi:SDR family NAD(P)-dependent oxidoreductase [Endozoicomonas sp.]|uniref:SDR family NAD(P)-dependent oxidoreductase n=1 Tax=Endozoicomonas sp. TaxID=1892382 RepID=UPI003AF40E51
MMDAPVALITGAANGLGWALSQQFWQAGYSLCLVDLDQQGLEARKAFLLEMSSSTQKIELCAVNLLESDAIECIKGTLSRHFTSLDVLVNNAGITHRSLARETSIDVIEKVMALDFLVPVKLTQQLFEQLANSGSRKKPTTIINIGSMAGWMPVMARSGYCAAKSALHQYFETLRAETAHLPLNILMVYPSFLATDIEKNALAGNGQKATHARSTIGNIQSAEWMAKQIIHACHSGKSRLFPSKAILLASLFYRWFPGIYLRMMSRKFKSELSIPAEVQQVANH